MVLIKKLNRLSLADKSNELVGVSDDENALNDDLSVGLLGAEDEEELIQSVEDTCFINRADSSSSLHHDSGHRLICKGPFLPASGREESSQQSQLANQEVGLYSVHLRPRGSESGFLTLPLKAKLTMDCTLLKIGVTLPEMPLPQGVDYRSEPQGSASENKWIDVFIKLMQMRGASYKMLRCKAKLNQTYDALAAQFIQLKPFVVKRKHSQVAPIDMLLEGLTEDELQSTIRLVNQSQDSEVFSLLGPNQDSMLAALCCKRVETAVLRAQIFALTLRILSHPDPKKRENLIHKNTYNLSALDFTAISNNYRVAVFLTELFYLLGEDILARDSYGNTLFHMMARKGNYVAATMDALLSLHYSDEPNVKVFSTAVKNSRDFLPIHIAVMDSTCPDQLISILHRDYPLCLSQKTVNGSTPLHFACQYAKDSSTLATLLTIDSSMINMAREDGMCPLHLVAMRTEHKNAAPKLEVLCEEEQLQMIKLLLQYGADKTRIFRGKTPSDVVASHRDRVKRLFSTDQPRANGGDHEQNGQQLPLLEDDTPAISEAADLDEIELEAIVESLISHPSIQSVIEGEEYNCGN